MGVVPFPSHELRVPGCGRDAENEKALVFSFSRKVTDDEMRFLHECLQRAVHIAPEASRP